MAPLASTDRIVSRRLEQSDAHTIAGYEGTGGYEGLKAALGRPPQEIVDEVKTASLLGRGGAGFPCGVKWGFCPRASGPAMS